MGHCRIDKLIRIPAGERGVFVDTGAYLGQSIANALEDGFSKAVGIEVSPANFEATRKRFADDRRVELHRGSSHALLASALAPHLGERIVVWLDGHYQGYDRAEYCAESGECPVLAEIAVVLQLAPRMVHAPVLLIDDAQMFYEPFWRADQIAVRFTRSDWPTYEQIKQALGAAYAVRLHSDEEGQALVCTPIGRA